MTRAYLRVDPAFFERKALTQDYPVGVFAALVGTLCLAETQPERGRFRSERLLRALLEKYGRHVPELIRRTDLVVLPDGRLYVDGWDEWQEGDWKVNERVARIRSRPRRGSVTVDVTPDVTADVTVGVTADRLAVGAGGSGAVSGRRRQTPARVNGPEPIAAILPDVVGVGPPEEAYGVSEDEVRVFAFLARFGAAIRPDSGYGRRLLGLIERRGVEEVLRHAGLMSRGGKLSDRQWVFGLEDALEAVPSGKEAQVSERAEDAARAHQRRLEATRQKTAAEREALAARGQTA